MARPDNQIERTEAALNPPRWLAWIVVMLLPPNDRQGPQFLLQDLWSKSPSVQQVLPQLSLAILKTVCFPPGRNQRDPGSGACEMNLDIVIQILQLGLSLLTHTSGTANGRIAIAETLFKIVQVAAKAYHAHVGQPIDLSLINPETAI